MHMADALISPAVGGAFWAAAAGVTAYSIKKVQSQSDQNENKIPLMGVMGAFVFAAQMINFTIPGTGSSGHLGGGILLAAILGPYAGFLTMSSILIIQALLFADGGLLSLGASMINLGFYTCFLAYPLIYKSFIKNKHTTGQIFTGSLLASILGLQIGAFSVVMQTLLSGKTELPFGLFVLFMQPIHLAIGIVEGLITAAVIIFVWRSRPELLEQKAKGSPGYSTKKVLVSLLVTAVFIAGFFSWFASTHPDGLEWAIYKTHGQDEIESPSDGIYGFLANIQEKLSFLPDYSFKSAKEPIAEGVEDTDKNWMNPDAGTSLSGLLGAAATLLLTAATGFIIHWFKKYKRQTA